MPKMAAIRSQVRPCGLRGPRVRAAMRKMTRQGEEDVFGQHSSDLVLHGRQEALVRHAGVSCDLSVL